MSTPDQHPVHIRQRVRIPLCGIAEPVDFVSFNGLPPGDEPIALVFGTLQTNKPTLLRLHSECLTGDVFHSLKCDCGAQLHEAMEALSASDGVLLYLRQEGRGIGLYAKLDAYQLQARGLDTFAANRALGFGDDLRSFADSAAMLRALGIGEVELISNNPDKARQLEAHGIRVVRVHPTALHVNAHNRSYLAAKKQQHAHTLDLDGPTVQPTSLTPSLDSGSNDMTIERTPIATSRIAFIQASWHKEIVDQSREGFLSQIQTLGYPVSNVDVFTLPGAFEIPLHAKLLAQSGKYQAIVAAGLVVDGGIYRHDFVAQSVVTGLMQVQLETQVPVFSVVLTPHHFHAGEEHQQFFFNHFDIKGREAANAVAQTLHSLRHLTESRSSKLANTEQASSISA